MLPTENSLAARAHAAGDDIETSLADVAVRAHLGAREDPEEAHLARQRSFAALGMTTSADHGRFVLLLFGRTFAMVQTTIVAQPP